jgi:hypothetical protein
MPFVTGAVPVYLPEDEFTLPPLFSQIASSDGAAGTGINVITVKGQKRHALKGEWFDYGDRLSLPANRAIEVIQRETIKWIAGGVFEGQMGRSLWLKEDPSYEVILKRGWMKGWVKPDADKAVIRITTPEEVFEIKDGVFWLGAHTGKTELYVLKGEVKPKSSERPYGAGTYLFKESNGSKAGSREWDGDAMEVRIAAAYPSLGQLLTKAQKDWDSGKSEVIYGTFRKKGWRRAHRFNGDSVK